MIGTDFLVQYWQALERNIGSKPEQATAMYVFLTSHTLTSLNVFKKRPQYVSHSSKYLSHNQQQSLNVSIEPRN